MVYECDQCSFRSMNLKALELHTKEKHPDKEVKNNHNKEEPKNNTQSIKQPQYKSRTNKNCFNCVHARPAELPGRCFCDKMKIITGSGRARICSEFVRDKWAELRELGKTWTEIETEEVNRA